MTMRARRAALIVAVVLTALGVGATAAPVGAATAPPKAMVLSATPATTVWSQATKLSLSLTPKGGGTPKGGTLTFRTGDVLLGTATATKRITTFSTGALPVGEHPVTATYSGDGTTGEATSNTVVVTVAPAPTTIALSTAGPVVPGERAELKAVVRTKAPASGQNRPDGTVTFATGSTRATVRVNATGVATWRPLLAAGTHEVTATYDGTTTFAPSTSAPTTQVVAEPDHTDQANPAGSGVTLAMYADNLAGTTFTAGRTGTLDHVDLDIASGAGSFTLTIRTVSGGVPTGTVLGQGSGTIQPGVLSVDLATPASVQAGTRYAIVLDTSERIVLRGSYDTYAGGQWVQTNSGAWTLQWSNLDLAFTTEVVPAG